MKPVVPLKGGEEYDAFTRWRRFLRWRAGDRRKIKRRFWKRARRLLKAQEKPDDVQ